MDPKYLLSTLILTQFNRLGLIQQLNEASSVSEKLLQRQIKVAKDDFIDSATDEAIS